MRAWQCAILPSQIWTSAITIFVTSFDWLADGCRGSASSGDPAPESISITGQQDGFIVRQRFRHDAPTPQDVRYIVPNNCMYDTTFRIGSEI
jgi:hypothetical protein